MNSTWDEPLFDCSSFLPSDDGDAVRVLNDFKRLGDSRDIDEACISTNAVTQLPFEVGWCGCVCMVWPRVLHGSKIEEASFDRLQGFPSPQDSMYTMGAILGRVHSSERNMNSKRCLLWHPLFWHLFFAGYRPFPFFEKYMLYESLWLRLCAFWARGSCKRGTSCAFAHGEAGTIHLQKRPNGPQDSNWFEIMGWARVMCRAEGFL